MVSFCHVFTRQIYRFHVGVYVTSEQNKARCFPVLSYDVFLCIKTSWQVSYTCSATTPQLQIRVSIKLDDQHRYLHSIPSEPEGLERSAHVTERMLLPHRIRFISVFICREKKEAFAGTCRNINSRSVTGILVVMLRPARHDPCSETLHVRVTLKQSDVLNPLTFQRLSHAL